MILLWRRARHLQWAQQLGLLSKLVRIPSRCGCTLSHMSLGLAARCPAAAAPVQTVLWTWERDPTPLDTCTPCLDQRISRYVLRHLLIVDAELGDSVRSLSGHITRLLLDSVSDQHASRGCVRSCMRSVDATRSLPWSEFRAAFAG
jgi:hypothetical protein